jgi:hypothetical protein
MIVLSCTENILRYGGSWSIAKNIAVITTTNTLWFWQTVSYVVANLGHVHKTYQSLRYVMNSRLFRAFFKLLNGMLKE